jgi:exopolyphosphatase/guanosine-5'-triphosphate,3'-diphosphate pyrophosphatase
MKVAAIRKPKAIEKIPDLRRRSVLKLAAQCAHDAPHSQHVARLSLAVLEQTRHLHELPSRYDEILEFAALLHDVGYHINTTRHHRHTYYLIKNGDLRGFSPEEVEMIASIGRYHRGGAPHKKHSNLAWLPKQDRHATKVLSAILRVADGLDRSHYQLIKNVHCGMVDHRVILELETDKDVELEIWGARKKAELLEHMVDRRLLFRVAGARQS